jgi:malonate-semialdehyde dehydrogenase (acetylating)/methylmalonate-semialdehyde dehydrogenase
MALSVAIFVGAARDWIPDLIARAKDLKISGGFEEGTDLHVSLPGLAAYTRADEH